MNRSNLQAKNRRRCRG